MDRFTNYNFMLQDTVGLEMLEQLTVAMTVNTKDGASTSDSPKDIGGVVEVYKSSQDSKVLPGL